jgi:hypothetical protein
MVFGELWIEADYETGVLLKHGSMRRQRFNRDLLHALGLGQRELDPRVLINLRAGCLRPGDFVLLGKVCLIPEGKVCLIPGTIMSLCDVTRP